MAAELHKTVRGDAAFWICLYQRLQSNRLLQIISSVLQRLKLSFIIVQATIPDWLATYVCQVMIGVMVCVQRILLARQDSTAVAALHTCLWTQVQ